MGRGHGARHARGAEHHRALSEASIFSRPLLFPWCLPLSSLFPFLSLLSKMLSWQAPAVTVSSECNSCLPLAERGLLAPRSPQDIDAYLISNLNRFSSCCLRQVDTGLGIPRCRGVSEVSFDCEQLSSHVPTESAILRFCGA